VVLGVPPVGVSDEHVADLSPLAVREVIAGAAEHAVAAVVAVQHVVARAAVEGVVPVSGVDLSFPLPLQT
jgi:hypothetical protein